MSIDLRANCVAQYKLNDLSGTTVVDSQGFSNGTSANPVTPVTGKINGALSFNGTSDYINTNSKFETVFQNSFSITLWFSPNVNNQSKAIFGIYNLDEGGSQLYLSLSVGRVEWEYRANGSYFYCASPSSGRPTTPNWYCIVFAVTKNLDNSGTFKCFKNNVEITGGSVVGTIDMSSMVLPQNILIANDSISSPYIVNGKMDNVCIFNKALSTDEIAFLYNSGNGTEELTDIVPEGIFDYE